MLETPYRACWPEVPPVQTGPRQRAGPSAQQEAWIMSTLDRRSFLAAGAAAAALPALAACGGSDSEASSGTLQFVLSGDANQGGGFAAMAKKYEEETGTVVEI